VLHKSVQSPQEPQSDQMPAVVVDVDVEVVVDVDVDVEVEVDVEVVNEIVVNFVEVNGIINVDEEPKKIDGL